MATPSKTVYILGAGFSIPAGGPTQQEILNQIWDLDDGTLKVAESKALLYDFLKKTLNVDEHNVSLEDIYTPIDRCLADGLSLRGKNQGQLQDLRGSTDFLISQVFKQRFAKFPALKKRYVHAFARILVSQAAKRAELAKGAVGASAAKEYDPFSIISLNWDILLDSALNRAIQVRDLATGKGDFDPFGVVDYCCYINSIKSSDKRIRSGLWTLGCRGYNVKLLKVHGSMNWLQCPSCQRLFVGFDEKLNVLNYINASSCRFCKKHGHDTKLQGSLVMPTFLKDLSNIQIKLIWQNAGVELMEARRLVFIGYSLPHADFEFRQLLSRMVHKDAEIDVVLFNSEQKKGTESPQYSEETRRYRQFFSAHKPRFHPNGVEEYVERMHKDQCGESMVCS